MARAEQTLAIVSAWFAGTNFDHSFGYFVNIRFETYHRMDLDQFETQKH